jgi:hypothetical protein
MCPITHTRPLICPILVLWWQEINEGFRLTSIWNSVYSLRHSHKRSPRQRTSHPQRNTRLLQFGSENIRTFQVGGEDHPQSDDFQFVWMELHFLQNVTHRALGHSDFSAGYVWWIPEGWYETWQSHKFGHSHLQKGSNIWGLSVTDLDSLHFFTSFLTALCVTGFLVGCLALNLAAASLWVHPWRPPICPVLVTFSPVRKTFLPFVRDFTIWWCPKKADMCRGRQ